jgi:hypothetical protein
MQMREAVVRALEPNLWDAFDSFCRSNQFSEQERNDAMRNVSSVAALESADAAILAVLEHLRDNVSEGMVRAGIVRSSGFADAGNRMCNGYRAMIEQAIKEHKEAGR